MAGLAVQNFVSAAVGIVRRDRAHPRASPAAPLGNFWQDLTRAVLYVLLPISFVGALVLASQGVVAVARPSGARWPRRRSSRSSGPTAAGSSTTNSAMPFENPNGLTNFLEMLAMLAIPASLTFTYGRMVGSRRQGWTIFGAMFVLFAISVAVVYIAESDVTPAQHAAGIDRREPGGQGAALRHRRLGAVDRDHHGHLERRGQRRVRVADRDRRARPDGQPGLRRERLRRRRHRPLHDAALRPAGGLHRRADGRPHARVPGQEDRGARDQARRARPAVHAAGDPRRAPASRRRTDLRRRRRSSPPARRASARRSTPTCRRPTTTARRSPATRATSSPSPATSAPTGSRSPTCSAA